jgi:hypothetical protein
MSVCGGHPTSDVGVYFENNVWWWHALWTYITLVAPTLVEGVSGDTNDGDGFDAAGAGELARLLTVELESGRTAELEAAYIAWLGALPDKRCEYCDGAGTCTDAFEVEHHIDTRRWCNRCNGKGSVRPIECSYPFSAENVAKFRDFVAASGGFSIY